MTIELRELRHPQSAGRRLWPPPFDRDVGYENHAWWLETHYPDDDCWYVQAPECGVEVARVRFVSDTTIDEVYEDVPELGADGLEVERIEVALAKRSRGIGTAVIKALEARYPDKRLFAYALEGAEGFWSAAGWSRHRWKLSSDNPHDSLYMQCPTLPTSGPVTSQDGEWYSCRPNRGAPRRRTCAAP